ncbi:MAG: hypothetical protein J5994_10765 [Ruminococcus sp.]|nr:hypothetical protein [Ruminococcus sp.]
MKAWIAGVKDEFGKTVVFSETRGKAKSIALTTDVCEDADYCDIEVHRLPQADHCYKNGKTEMDWNDPADRLILVRDFGFYCEYVDPDKCKHCCAREFCEEYQIKI